MDKLTVFGVLAFLIPGSLCTGILYYLALTCQVDISYLPLKDYSFLGSLSFFGISYIFGFVVSELAFSIFKCMDKKFFNGHKFNHAARVQREFDLDFLRKLSDINTKNFDLKLIHNLTDKILLVNIKNSFYLWVETLAINTSDGLTAVLRGQYMMFRNIFYVLLITILATSFALVFFWPFHIYELASFKIIILFYVIMLPIAYIITVNRFGLYTKVTTRNPYIYLSKYK